MALSQTRNILLLTAFLDILGMALLLPIFPDLVKSFGLSGSWVGYSFALYSGGMFLGGIIFGKLSDFFGRKPILLLTSILNLLGFLSLIFAPSAIWFLLGRIISGFAGAGLSVTQAGMSDISKEQDRTRNMGLIGAMFGLGFLIGPAIGGGLSLISADLIPQAGAIAALLNILVIIFLFQETHVKIRIQERSQKKPGKKVLELFFLSFFITLAFSPIQSISTQFQTDVFHFTPQLIAGVLIVVGASSILYQGFLIGKVRKYLNEVQFILFGTCVLALAFLLYSLNNSSWFLFALLPLFPLGMGSLQPAIGALLAQEGKESTGFFLGMNQSSMSIGNIVGPIVSGYLYSFGPRIPFLMSGFLFGLGILGVYFLFFSRRIGGQY